MMDNIPLEDSQQVEDILVEPYSDLVYIILHKMMVSRNLVNNRLLIRWEH